MPMVRRVRRSPRKSRRRNPPRKLKLASRSVAPVTEPRTTPDSAATPATKSVKHIESAAGPFPWRSTSLSAKRRGSCRNCSKRNTRGVTSTAISRSTRWRETSTSRQARVFSRHTCTFTTSCRSTRRTTTSPTRSRASVLGKTSQIASTRWITSTERPTHLRPCSSISSKLCRQPTNTSTARCSRQTSSASQSTFAPSSQVACAVCRGCSFSTTCRPSWCGSRSSASHSFTSSYNSAPS
mmetsp:Transcript_57518/g.135343  ORF Transcript_57518/g.135343 Transcript_57518/m.135343 type:complete len:239 (-) Transcript_57518:167-883(-)